MSSSMDSFVRHLVKVAAAQIAQESEFIGLRKSCLETLADVMQACTWHAQHQMSWWEGGE